MFSGVFKPPYQVVWSGAYFPFKFRSMNYKQKKNISETS